MNVQKSMDGSPSATTSKMNCSTNYKNSLSVKEILAIGEKMNNSDSVLGSENNTRDSFDTESSDDSSCEWEEVEDGVGSPEKNLQSSIAPEGDVVVTIANTDGTFGRQSKKKKQFEDYLRLHLNRKTREAQIDLHKVSLLCLLGRGIMINNWLRSEELLAIALSIIPTPLASVPRQRDLPHFQRIMTWFRRTYSVNSFSEESENVIESLKSQFTSKKNITSDTHVYLFILILRSLGLDARLIWSLQPLPLKPSKDDLIPVKKDDVESTKEVVDPSSVSNTSSKSGKKEAVKSKQKGKTDTKNQKKSEKLGRKIISSDEEDDNNLQTVNKVSKSKTKKRADLIQKQDVWLEVFLQEEERWISVALESGKVICEKELEAKATKPISYVLGFDNAGRVKDLTRRYAELWLTATTKLRVDSEWWNETIIPFEGESSLRDTEEDEFLDSQLMSQSLPKSVSGYKGHPLFALRCHLLKYEAIYPPDPPVLGFVNKEPVYSRDCVRLLHTREVWSKKAKVVRIGEVPYKVVKARAKYDRRSKRMIDDNRPMDLFGEWQVEDYIPPVAKDGKVPRNGYGNVEMYQDSMLPTGTVHLRLPGLNRVAKKLDIDCAPALTGFEYGHTGNRPVFDGFIVCEEFKDVILDAWNQEQDEQKKRQEEKRLTRIYGNWRKLVKGLLIRQMLEKKYSYSFPSKRKLDETPSTSGAAAKKQKK